MTTKGSRGQRIRRLLAFESEWEVIGECANGAEAVSLLERERIDVIFLDVQMPCMDGFGVVAALERWRPLIVFTSAYDESRCAPSRCTRSIIC